MMKKIKYITEYLLLVLFSCCVFCACSTGAEGGNIKNAEGEAGSGITALEESKVPEVRCSVITEYSELTEIAERIKTDTSVVLVDLRDNSDFEYAHVEGAVNIPFDDDGKWLISYLKNDNLGEKDIYLMCGKGKKSAKAFNLLIEEGYLRLHYVAFGFDEFRESEGGASLEGAGVCDCEKK